jgi:hypothetical protein
MEQRIPKSWCLQGADIYFKRAARASEVTRMTYICVKVRLANLHKTMSCKVKASSGRAIFDVVRVAAGALGGALI